MSGNNPYQTPKSDVSENAEAKAAGAKYAGFWPRTLATIIDSIWLYGIIYAILIFTIGYSESFTPVQFTFEYVIPFIVVIAFWKYKQATPGKILFGMRIVDADTLGEVSTTRLVVRYLAYFISMLPLFLGFVWVAFDSRKQGWHDKIARTVIVRG
jgi:uncharacterized RDD family membrane protein YckC